MRAARAVRSFFSALRISPNLSFPPGAGRIRRRRSAWRSEEASRAESRTPAFWTSSNGSGIPIHCITGVSAGSIVAAAYASGASPAEIARGRLRHAIRRCGALEPLPHGLRGQRAHEALPGAPAKAVPLRGDADPARRGRHRPLHRRASVAFRDSGDVFLPIRASCSYPGLFQPVRYEDRLLVDGAMSMEIPAILARQLGATHVISVHLPAQDDAVPPQRLPGGQPLLSDHADPHRRELAHP